MRLIDADLLTEKIKRYRCILNGLRNGKGLLSTAADQYRRGILQIIDDQPTAFDKEKVIEELENLKDIPQDDSVAEIVSTRIWKKAIEKAIKNEAIEIAIHCLGVQAEQEVCEECQVYRESGIACREIARTAISALKEFQKYHEIGTVEECREAVEKRKPKKPVLRNDNGKLRKSCPVCGCFFSPLSRSCPKCGQAIQWNENLEGMEDE